MTKSRYLLIMTLCIAVMMGVMPTPSSATNTPWIDSQISIVSAWKNESDGYVYVTYDLLQDLNTSQQPYLKIGYEWPTDYRGAYPNKYKTSPYTKTGRYTIQIASPENAVSKLAIVTNYGDYTYNEKKVWRTVLNAPTGIKTDFHEVTSTDINASKVVMWAPALALEFSPATKYTKAIGRTYLAWSLTSDYLSSQSGAFPSLQIGQYYRTDTSYLNTGIKVRTRVWNSYTAYSRGDLPLYDGTHTHPIPQ